MGAGWRPEDVAPRAQVPILGTSPLGWPIYIRRDLIKSISLIVFSPLSQLFLDIELVGSFAQSAHPVLISVALSHANDFQPDAGRNC